jgi:hypothetical protein
MAKWRFGRRGLWFAGAVATGILAYGAFADRVAADRTAGPAVATESVAGAPASTRDADGHHPAPRPAAEREGVVPATRYAEHARIANVYRAAAEIPEVLDGIHCYCNCAEHAGHYSLLSCFASDHAAMCDICMSEAETAFRLSRDGVELELIRDVIDRTFGS